MSVDTGVQMHPHKQEKQKGRKGSKEASQNTGHQESLSRKNEKKAKPFAVPALEETGACADTPGNSEKQHRTSLTSPEWSPGICVKGSQNPVEGDLVWSSGGSQPWAKQEGQTTVPEAGVCCLCELAGG